MIIEKSISYAIDKVVLLMKTRKAISTISYNSDLFLSKKLIELEQKRKIVFWMYINHHREDDEAKDHKHLFIIPNGEVNTEEIETLLEELDSTNAKPLKCIHFRSSKFDDAYLYYLHDEGYLLSKGQSRKYHYSDDDLIVSDQVYFNECKHLVDRSKLNGNKISLIKEYVNSKKPFFLLVSKGVVPIQQIRQWEMAYNLMWQMKYGDLDSLTIRGEGETHE